jgi:hypothetical protein
MASSDEEGPSTDSTTYLIRHIVLPPQLPHTDDRERSKDILLLETSLLALQDLKNVVNDNQIPLVDGAITIITNLKRTCDNGDDASEADLHMLLDELTKNTLDRVVPIEFKAQNAAILLSRCANHIFFECFELSPTNEAATKKGRLIRVFPALASRVTVSQMNEGDLKKTLASTMAKLISQDVLDFQPKVHKASCDHVESRDTVNPAMVTDWFMNVTAALGESIDTVRITKHTREEVLWQEKQPWRRSPLWLLLRVSLHLFFTRQRIGSVSSAELYKAFGIVLLSRLLRMVCS